MARRRAKQALPPEPGEAPPQLHGLHEVDEQRVTLVLKQAKQLYSEGVLAFYKALGSLLLDTFYGGSSDAWHASGRNHVSCLRVTELLHEHLGLSHSTVWASISLIEHLQLLDDDVGDGLTMTHHRLLMGVSNVRTRKRVAKAAYTKGWSSRQLKTELEKLKKPADARGRPRLPRFVKSLHALQRMLEQDEHGFADLELLEQLSNPEELQRLHKTAAAMRQQAQRLEQALQQRLEEAQDERETS